MVGNDEFRGNPGQLRSRLIDWIFLPLPIAFALMGVGILAGLIFQENLLLQGSMRFVVGIGMTLYGAVRSVLIIKRLSGRKKEKSWIKKY